MAHGQKTGPRQPRWRAAPQIIGRKRAEKLARASCYTRLSYRRTLGLLLVLALAAPGLQAIATGPAGAAARGTAAPLTRQPRLAAGLSTIRWQRQVTPSPPSSFLYGVSCPTTGSCVAVGTQFVGGRVGALVESWSNAKWDVVATPQPPGKLNANLSSVSCAALGSCVAVGVTYPSSSSSAVGLHPFSEVLHGTKWKIVPTAPLSVTGAQFNGVSCWVPGSCFAVGSFTQSEQGGALAEVYQGSAWSLDKLPATGPGEGSLASVSCLPATTPALCTAVGSLTGARAVPLVMHANGEDWQVWKVPGVPSSSSTTLSGVSCPQPNACMAVGKTTTLSGSTSSSFSERFDQLVQAGWSVVPTPKPSAPGAYLLSGVSCPQTDGACEAVGFGGAAAPAPLTEGWNGYHWALQSSAGAGQAVLEAVACPYGIYPAPCTAVGFYSPNPTSAQQTLALRLG